MPEIPEPFRSRLEDQERRSDPNDYLKTCPFCGGKAEVNHVSLGGYETGYDVRCPDCGCGTDYCEEKQDAVNAWNKRQEVAE